jgi:hypothetical protein
MRVGPTNRLLSMAITKHSTSSRKKGNTSVTRKAYGRGTTMQPITISSKNPTRSA